MASPRIFLDRRSSSFPRYHSLLALFDHGTGIFAVLLSALLSKWFFIAPVGSLAAAGPELLGLFFFVVIGLITAGIAEALHRVAADLTKANKGLIAAEAEKSVQLAEASHRFKNELAILSSLLRLELRNLADPAARAALSATSSRIRVIARLHDRLEISESAAAVIDTREFIHALCDDLTQAMIGMRPIDLKVEAERHLMPQELALMLGLIINEFVVNALKHAFPDERPGTIVVTFQCTGDEFILAVVDDGIGLIGPVELRSRPRTRLDEVPGFQAGWRGERGIELRRHRNGRCGSLSQMAKIGTFERCAFRAHLTFSTNYRLWFHGTRRPRGQSQDRIASLIAQVSSGKRCRPSSRQTS